MIDTGIGRLAIALALMAPALLGAGTALAREDVAAGEAMLDRPTLISLGFLWQIEGDENRNASVRVEYRKAGDPEWSLGYPALRQQRERTFSLPAYDWTAPNAFAGSLFDLAEDTDYEIRLTLSDPDGVTGEAVRVLHQRTRAEPRPAAGGRTFHVYPPGWKGEKQKPAFTGLLAAYYMGSAQADHFNVFPTRVKPGDTILVHAGLYKDHRANYGGFDRSMPALGTVFDGTYYLTAKGTPAAPIVIKGAGDGEAIFDGDGNAVLFDLMGSAYNYFEGITVRNTEVGFLTGRKHIVGSGGFTLKHSRIENVGRGVYGDWAGSKDFYIADNVFVGRHPADKLLGWIGRTWGKVEGFPALVSGPTGSEIAVKVYGQGHVVAYNSVSRFHDGIDHATYGTPEGGPADWPSSNDFYGNDFNNIGDNCIEADGMARNARVFRNRCFNSASAGLSVQPGFGGPFYFFRNLVVNNPTGSLKFTGTSSGIVFANNTIVGEAMSWGPIANVHFRNNVFVGQGAAKRLFDVETSTAYSSADYDSFVLAAPDQQLAAWSEVEVAGSRVGRTPEDRKSGFGNLRALRKGTGQERHGRMLSRSDFVHLPVVDVSDITRLYAAKDFDFGLARRSAAVDAGTVLPNLTDGYVGRAPDLGAFERGEAQPHYGPRPVADR